MIAQVLPGRFHQGGVAEATAVLHEHGLPAARQLPGFRGGLWLHDPATDEALQITLWDTEADLQAAGESTLLDEAVARMGRLLAEEGQERTYTVMHWGPGSAP